MFFFLRGEGTKSLQLRVFWMLKQACVCKHSPQLTSTASPALSTLHSSKPLRCPQVVKETKQNPENTRILWLWGKAGMHCVTSLLASLRGTTDMYISCYHWCDKTLWEQQQLGQLLMHGCSSLPWFQCQIKPTATKRCYLHTALWSERVKDDRFALIPQPTFTASHQGGLKS